MDKYISADIVILKFCKQYIELTREMSVRPSEMGVLNIIVQKEGLYTPVMIAEILEVSKPMITAHITALEKKGFVKREYSKEDKRSFYVIPTEKAKELVTGVSKATRMRLQQLEVSLGKEKFGELLDTLTDTNIILKELT